MGEFNLFISHSWSYADNYDDLCKLLDQANYFRYKNYSVPEDDPLFISAKNDYWYRLQLKRKIRDQMQYASVVIILAGVYATYSDSIQLEIEVAKELGKPILAIELYGSERSSQVVKSAADRIVSWNTNSIVNAIRELG